MIYHFFSGSLLPIKVFKMDSKKPALVTSSPSPASIMSGAFSGYLSATRISAGCFLAISNSNFDKCISY